MNGIIIINKEKDFTSFDVVAKLRGICGQKKIGHTGTLDPQAVGVLPVCLGNATKLCDMLTAKDKEYVAELLLGVTTDTQDMTGKILTEQKAGSDSFTVKEIEAVIMSFVGEYDQIPPMYSALKVNGKKLYELAREGKEVIRKPRRVLIESIEILGIELPVVKLKVQCSKGTYIRTLCADIGEKLGCGAAMQSLVRTRVGRFVLEDALTLSQVQRLKDEGRLESAVLSTDSVFTQFGALHIKDEWRKLADNGNAFFPNQTDEDVVYPNGEWVRVYDSGEVFIGIYAYEEDKQWYKPVKMFK